MDLATTIGLASSIITFIDFSCSLVRGSYELYHSPSGFTKENAQIRDIIDDLREVTEGLQTDFQGQTKHEKELVKLAEQCEFLSKDLLDILQKVGAKGDTRWDALKAKVKSMRKEKEVAFIEKRLGKYRGEIVIRLNLMLHGYNSTLKQSLDKMQREGSALSSQTTEELKDLRNDIRDLTSRLERAVATVPGNAAIPVATATENGLQTSEYSEEAHTLLHSLRSALAELKGATETLPKEVTILRRLYFDSMHRREDAVHEAEGGTFQWLLDRPDLQAKTDFLAVEGMPSNAQSAQPITSGPKYWGSPAQPLRKSSTSGREAAIRFTSFLREGSGIFFIYGKAGSGKSTLMKFLATHPRVQEELRIWSNPHRVVFVSTYFWNSGDTLQKSLEGFYRTVLFEVLKQCPKLIPQVFPDQWQQASLETALSTSFRLPEIEAAMGKLGDAIKSDTHRFCFFVDGLDEYEGGGAKHLDLARSFDEWGRSRCFKMVCAARPHVEFMSTFTDLERHLQLHTFNKDDIRRYVESKFKKELQSEPRTVSPQVLPDLVGKVVERAEGVFLWAYLVTQSLLDGIRHGDTERALINVVLETPRDLNVLFKKMLAEVDPIHQKRSKAMLQITANNPSNDPLPALIYSWLEDLEDREFPFNQPVKQYTIDEVERRETRVQKQLALLTKGILEAHPVGGKMFSQRYTLHVDFFHQTARDYVRESFAASGSTTAGFEDYVRLFYAMFLLCDDDHVTKIAECRSWADFQHCRLPDRIVDGIFSTYSQIQQQESSETRQGLALGRCWLSRQHMGSPRRLNTGARRMIQWGIYAHLGEKGNVQRRLEARGGSQALTAADWSALLCNALFSNVDHELLDYLLKRRALLDMPIMVVPNFPSLPESPRNPWMVFLFFFSKLIYPQNARFLNIERNLDVHYQTMQLLLRHGADRQALILLTDHTDLYNPDRTVAKESIYAIGLRQLLELINPPPPNIVSLLELCSEGLGARARRVISSVVPWASGRPEKYRRLETSTVRDLNKSHTKWWVCGVVSGDDELLRQCTVHFF